MQAIRFLHRALAQALPSIHSRRLTSLMSCVSSLLHGRRLTLTALGRFIKGRAYPKHSIKRVDRLLGNQHLRSERPLFYWVMLRALLGSLKHPLILVDWSRIDASGTAFLLRASIPLIAALANYLLFLTGLQARKSNLERRYQSNSLRERRVLSLWRLDLEYWRKCIEFGGSGDWETLEKALRDEVHHQAQSLE